MKEISIEEVKDLQLEILEKVHQFCVKQHIRYFMVYGTLLGAIRHKGYIPWDDDIDIAMPRPDYEKFLRSFNGYYKELTVNAPELDWNFFESYANVYDNRTILYEETNPHNGVEIGVKIDIFPFDGVPTDMAAYKQLRWTMRKLNALRGTKKETFMGQIRRLLRTGKGIRGLWIKCKHPFCTYIDVQKEIRALATQCEWKHSEYADQATFQKTLDTRMKRQVFEQYIEVPFENHRFMALADSDTYLRTVFGDYMQLPPENQRVYSHGFTAFWKD